MSDEIDNPAGHSASESLIKKEEAATKGRFFMQVDGSTAEMTFSRAGEHMIIIDHTEVPDSLRGMGLGHKLLAFAVEDARKNGLTVLPLCPFAKSLFQRHAEFRDVLTG